jgi:hypothetical protein
MNLARVSCRPGEEIALGKPHGHSLGRRLGQLGCSQERIALVGSPLRSRSLSRAGALRRASLDSTTIDTPLPKQILVNLQFSLIPLRVVRIEY